MAAIVLSVFAGAAVLLAVIGLYGVIAQSVSERRQEIGVRMALGATSDRILRLFLRHGLIIVAIGIGAGIAGGRGRGTKPGKPGVRRDRERSCHARHRRRPVGTGHVARLLPPGAIRDTTRSDDGLAIGVTSVQPIARLGTTAAV